MFKPSLIKCAIKKAGNQRVEGLCLAARCHPNGTGTLISTEGGSRGENTQSAPLDPTQKTTVERAGRARGHLMDISGMLLLLPVLV